ncbi:MAG: SufD family Fe-S cluster assembly protein [Nanoarchaeota archaeon]|nr:SufD family Fe-S cluster assembly protein [Nanoarchaeota archaeon]
MNQEVALESIPRGLGIITSLEGVKDIPSEKDNQSFIEASFPVIETNTINELFTEQGNDLIHQKNARSFLITIDHLEGFQKIIIHNRSHSDVVIKVKKATQGELFIEWKEESDYEFSTGGLTIVAEKETSFQLATKMSLLSEKVHLAKHLLVLEEKSSVLWFTQTSGTKQLIFDQKASLQGVGSSVKTKTLAKTEPQEKADITTISHHLAPKTESDIQFKSIAAKSRILAKGLVRIEPVADDSTGYQSSQVLLLDKESRAITIPDLEIENKNVTCSHGSTISSVSEEQLFYLQSRGIEKDLAKELIVKGFIDEIYHDLSPRMKKEMRGEIDEE